MKSASSKIFKQPNMKKSKPSLCSPRKYKCFFSPKQVSEMSMKREKQSHHYGRKEYAQPHSLHSQILQPLSAGKFHVSFKSISVLHLRLLQVLLFYSGILSILWRETVTTSQRDVFPKSRDCHGYGFTRGVSETGDAGTGTVTKFRHRA